MDVITMTVQNGAVTGLDVSNEIRTTYTIPVKGQPSSRLIDKTDGSVEMWELDSPIEINGSEFYVMLLDADYAKTDKASAYENEETWLRKYIGSYGAWRRTKSGGRHFTAILPRELAPHGLVQRTGLKALSGPVDLLTKRVWGNRAEYPWQDLDKPLPMMTQEFIDEFDLVENGSRGTDSFMPSDVVLSGFKLQVAEITASSHRIEPPSGSWSIAGSGRETALWSAALIYANDLHRRLRDPDDVWAGMALFVEQYLPLIPEDWARSFDAFERHNPSLRTRFLNDKQEIGTQGTQGTLIPRGRGSSKEDDTPGSLSEVLDTMREFHKRFVYHHDETVHDTIILWSVHTYAMEKYLRTPRLYVHSPEPDCGKSTQGELLCFMSKNAKNTTSITSAALFRFIDREHPAFIVDEADTLWNSKNPGNEEMRSMINSGYARNGTVIRCNATTLDPEEFKVYAAVALIGIDNKAMPDTILTRSIPIRMTRPGRGIELESWDEFDHDEFKKYLDTWLPIIAESVPDRDKPILPAHLRNRDAEIWGPLFTIANVVGGEWPQRVLNASLALHWEHKVSDQTKVLMLAKEFLDEAPNGRTTPQALTDYVNSAGQVDFMYSRGLANVLGAYGIGSHKTGSERYYLDADFEKPCSTWGLPPGNSVPCVPRVPHSEETPKPPLNPESSVDEYAQWTPERWQPKKMEK